MAVKRAFVPAGAAEPAPRRWKARNGAGADRPQEHQLFGLSCLIALVFGTGALAVEPDDSWLICPATGVETVYSPPDSLPGKILRMTANADSEHVHLMWVLSGETDTLWHQVLDLKGGVKLPPGEPTRIARLRHLSYQMVMEGESLYLTCAGQEGCVIRRWDRKAAQWREFANCTPARKGRQFTLFPREDMIFWVSLHDSPTDADDSPSTASKPAQSPEIKSALPRSYRVLSMSSRVRGSKNEWTEPVELLDGRDGALIDDEVSVFKRADGAFSVFALASPAGQPEIEELRVYTCDVTAKRLTQQGSWRSSVDPASFQVVAIPKTDRYYLIWRDAPGAATGATQLYWATSERSGERHELTPQTGRNAYVLGFCAAGFESVGGTTRGLVAWQGLSADMIPSGMASRLHSGRWGPPARLPVSSVVSAAIFTNEREGYFFAVSDRRIRRIPFRFSQ